MGPCIPENVYLQRVLTRVVKCFRFKVQSALQCNPIKVSHAAGKSTEKTNPKKFCIFKTDPFFLSLTVAWHRQQHSNQTQQPGLWTTAAIRSERRLLLEERQMFGWLSAAACSAAGCCFKFLTGECISLIPPKQSGRHRRHTEANDCGSGPPDLAEQKIYFWPSFRSRFYTLLFFFFLLTKVLIIFPSLHSPSLFLQTGFI